MMVIVEIMIIKKNPDLNISLKTNQKSRKNITKQLKKIDQIKQIEKIKASENLLNKQVSDAKKILELSKKYSELNAKSIAKIDELVKNILAKAKAREEDDRKIDETLKKYYAKEAQRASKKVEEFNKMIIDNLDMSSEKSEIINKLIKLNSLIQICNLNKVDNNSKANEKIDNVLISREISELEKRLRGLPKKGSGMFTSQKEFAKLFTFLAQLCDGNNSKKLKNKINQLLKSPYNSKQISELVYKNLIAAI